MKGGKAGGTTIDRECHALMHQRFGDAFTSLPYHKTGPGSDFMKSLEEIKRNFSHEDNDEIFELPLKMKLLDETEHGVFYNFEEDTVKLSRYVGLCVTAVDSFLWRELLIVVQQRHQSNVRQSAGEDVRSSPEPDRKNKSERRMRGSEACKYLSGWIAVRLTCFRSSQHVED